MPPEIEIFKEFNEDTVSALIPDFWVPELPVVLIIGSAIAFFCTIFWLLEG